MLDRSSTLRGAASFFDRSSVADRSSQYLPHVDGLRAYAVLAVILFHLQIWPFTGGYVGVDVFFVISGFLITRLIHAEIGKGRFSFSTFYIRRVRRLLPAFFVTLLFSFVAGCLLFAPDHLQRLVKSIVAAAFGIPNFFFWSEVGYFDLDAEFKPLLHTWSLGVEEQFYLVWPLALFLLLRKGGDRAALIALGVASAISLVSGQLLLPRDEETVFYLPFFRIFEFGIGAALVWLVQFRFERNLSSEICLGAGLALIFFAVFFYTHETSFPGVAALLPCVGTAMAIHSGRARILGRLLENKLAVGTGLISYSLYLIHLPLVVFYSYWSTRPLDGAEKTAIIFVSIVLAVAMYRFVETPFRRPKQPVNPLFIRGSVASMLVLVVVTIGTAKDGMMWRYSDNEKTNISLLGSYYLEQDCQFEHVSDTHIICRLGANRRLSPSVLIFGDSHGEMLAPGLDAYLKARNRPAVMVTAGGTLPFYSTVTFKDGKPREFTFQNDMEKYAEMRPQLAIIHAQFPSFWRGNYLEKISGDLESRSRNVMISDSQRDLLRESSQRAFIEGLEETLEFFATKGVQVLVVGGIPGLGQDPAKCIGSASVTRSQVARSHSCPRLSAEEALAEVNQVNRVISDIVSKFDNATYFDPAPAFCESVTNGGCDLFVDGKILYRDSHHISTFGSAHLVAKMKPVLDLLIK